MLLEALIPRKDRLLSGSAAGRLRTAAAALLVALPAALGALYISAYGVDVPFWDDWAVVHLLGRLEDGQLTLAGLWRQHSEHRIFFPKLIMLGLARLTRYDARAVMYTGWAMQCASTAILFLLLGRGERGWRETLIKFVPVSWLMFNLRQTDNLLWQIQLVVFLSLLCSLLAVYWLASSERRRWRFGLALASGVVGSFSMTNGLLVWPVGLLPLLGAGGPGRRLSRDLGWRVGVWAAAGAAVGGLYLWGYAKPPDYVPLSHALWHPTLAACYFVAYLANPLTGSLYPAMITGGLLLGLYLVVARISLGRGLTAEAGALLAVVLLTLLSGGLLVAGRSRMGVAQALSSRYVTLTSVGLSALYLLIIKLEPGARRAGLAGFALALIAIGMLTAYPAGVAAGRVWHAERKAAATYLRSYPVQRDENLRWLYPDANFVREHAPALERRRQSVFRDLAPGEFASRLVPDETAYALDRIDGQGVAPDSPPLKIAPAGAESIEVLGWAVDLPAAATAGGVFLILDGQTAIPASYGQPRRDVAAGLRDARYYYSGYNAAIPVALLGSGAHTLSLKIVRENGREYFQPGREFVVVVE